MLKKIKILMPGPVKFKFIKKGLEYYLKKIEPFVLVDTIFPKIKAKVSDVSIKVKKEEETIKKYILDKEYLIVLDERGKAFKSLELAEKLKILMQNQSYITFVIGGPEGISENLKKTAREVWSLSTLTLNHEIALLVLVEALYRSFTIIKGIPYHRE
ncbi:MAG: 23S rRNA pseudoU1915 N3-methylase RlmH [Thermodesulfobacterium sp.]|uniref:Ribosomal RNA large subunit methyltransferase H n=1 Tax=Candidatus Thermodesulfobacterium syntrophicum TaxID=3060442 RepID=A0AAE3P378_9BACT|nr:23S rRNA pseudoU1915 N3-methylase RlmH [Candidatus Thermodesulfobacterium syntrophicum]